MADLNGAALAREFARHVHETAEIARKKDPRHHCATFFVFSLTMASEISPYFTANGAAESTTDIAVLHLDKLESFHRVEQARGWLRTPIRASPNKSRDR